MLYRLLLKFNLFKLKALKLSVFTALLAYLLALFLSGFSSHTIAKEARDSKSAQKGSVSKKGAAKKKAEQSNVQFGAKAQKESADEAMASVKKISKNIQSLKLDVISLNKNLRLMEEQLLFPSNTKVAVFVSLDTGQFFTLESVKLKLDGQLVATHLYSDMQREAMARGGVQKLYITNLNEGKHTLTAFFTGKGPNGRAYKRAKELTFKKKQGSRYIEIAVRDQGSVQEPVFEIKQW